MICGKSFKPKDNLKVGKFCSQFCYWKDMSNRRGEQTSRWKKEVTYAGIHKWVSREYGKPNYCEFCKKTDCKKYQWANISGFYFRDINDWLRLCQLCHTRWDRLAQKKWLTQKGGHKCDINGIDFDGTLCSSIGENFMDSSPKEGAKKYLERLLSEGYFFYVFTAREPREWRQVAKWMFKNDIPGMPIHNIKLKGMTRFIDDRAIRFTNWEDIRKYFV